MKELTLGSLFDGIGGFPLAGSRYGIKALWASEIEPFPIKVTKIRIPDMVHLGDITKVNGAEIEPVDIITFGSPCQDLSVAGKRAGLAGERSGLFMEAVRIIKEMRNTYDGTNKPIRPRFAVWENVPGAFSSNKGEDFRAVLEELCRVKDETVNIPEPPKGKWSTTGAIMGNGWSIAWRILDAQYWGVPQRRRRIFLVADFGGQSAPEILFKRKGLSRNFTEGREAREGTTPNAERCFRETGIGYWGNGVGALRAQPDGTGGNVVVRIAYDAQRSTPKAIAIDSNCQDSRFKLTGGVVPTIPAKAGTGGNNGPMLAIPINDKATRHKGGGEARKNDGSGNGLGVGKPGDPCPTLTAGDKHAVCAGFNGYKSVTGSIQYQEESAATLEANMPGNVATYQNVTGPLMANSHPGSYTGQDAHSDMLVTPVYGLDRASFNQGANAQYDFQISEDDKTQTVVSRGPNAVAEPPRYSVRRLTPLECERLQGFPDGWTDIPGQAEATQEELEFWRDVWLTWDKAQAEDPEKVKPRTDKAILKWLKNPVSDSAQYKALGNSVAVPCPEYVIEGISEVLSTER